MSFFYYAGNAEHTPVPPPCRDTARFGRGPSRKLVPAIAAHLASRAAQISDRFDRFLHAVIEAIAASKRRRIERELQLRNVRYKSYEI